MAATININQLLTEDISLSDFLVKADENGLATKTTIQEFSNFLGTVGNLSFKGKLLIADTPTVDGWWFAGESGTYTNAGGLVISLTNNLSIIVRQTTFFKIEIPLDLGITLAEPGEPMTGSIKYFDGDKTITQIKEELTATTIAENGEKFVNAHQLWGVKQELADAGNSLEIAVNFKGNKKANNLYPKTSNLSTGSVGFTAIDVVTDEVLPTDSSKLIRATYGVNSGAYLGFLTTYKIPLVNGKGYYTSWIRRSDLDNIPDSLRIQIYTTTSSTTSDVVSLPYVIADDFKVGYTSTSTTGNTTVKLTVISEYNGWVLFFNELTTTSLTQTHFICRFWVNNIGLGQENKIDFCNTLAFGDINNVNILLPSLTSDDGAINFDEVEKINVANSDSIVFVADSYTESDYTLPDKSYIANVSALTDYQVRNYAKSGDDIIEAINRINDNEVRFNTTLGIKDFNSKYAVIALYANDSPYRYWSMDMFKENLRNLVQRLRGLGIEPIISSEFFLYNFFFTNVGVADTAIMQDIADELGIGFIDVAQTSMNFIKARENDFWNGSHPTTRTNSVMWKPVSDYLQSLPKPKKSIKLFRNRTVESNFATDTLYKNIEERNSKYQEIRVGHSALTDANLIYFDRQSLLGNPIDEAKNDEYLALQNGESVSFARHCLIEATVPYYSQDIDYIRLKIDTSATIFPWIRKKKAPFSTAKGTSFKFTGSPTIVIGDTYTITSSDGVINGKIITITDNRNGYICADATSYGYPSPTATGTLTRTSGTGTSSISFDGVLASFDDIYYTDYAKTYEWISLTSVPSSDGYWYIDNTSRLYCEGDKIVFLVRQTSGFSITGIEVDIPKKIGAEKIEVKGKYIEPLVYPANGSLISQRITGSTATLASWNQEGTIVESLPIGSANPRFCPGKVRLTDVNKISQSISYTSGRASQKIQIQVWANYEPAKFTGTDLATSPITLTSYDKTDLFIEIYSNGQEDKAIKFQRKVGLGFQQILIDTFLPPDMVSPKIRLSGSNLGVDVAYVDVLKYL